MVMKMMMMVMMEHDYDRGIFGWNQWEREEEGECAGVKRFEV
jgi:hypothetical protein